MAPPPGLSFGQQVKFALSSPRNFHTTIALDSASGAFINEDLVPSPPTRWTWNEWSYLAYWWSEAWAVSTWSVASSMVALGMSVGDALLVQLFACILSAVVIVFNGFAAERYHIGYPVLSRVTYGIFGSYFFVLLRSILGIIWGGVQLYFEGVFIAIMLSCIFPSFKNMDNTIPVSQGISTQNMIGFFLAFVFTIPFMAIHTQKLRYVFYVKSFLLPVVGMGIVIWATTANGGVSAGAIAADYERPTTIVYAFSIVAQFNSCMGSNSALLVTVPDLARYAKGKRAQIIGQLLGLPLSIVCAAFGCITTSAVANMWGVSYWNTYDLLAGILDHTYTGKSRAGVFFAAAAWAFATFGTSIACNITPFASDVTCLLPKYINIVRGQFLCLVVAFAITPWRILTSATTFLTFLSGYSIFQGSVVSIMIVDYFFVRRGNLDVAAMYTGAPGGKYYYSCGVNVRAVLAFVAGFALPLPGFIGSFGTAVVSPAAARMFDLGWPLSFAVGGATYYAACRLFPVPGQQDCARPFEDMVDDDWVLPDGQARQYLGVARDGEAADAGSAGEMDDEKINEAVAVADVKA
ncbi:hypothetical protein Q5752_003986 [Cryptotrichosporon argae]